MAPRKKMSSQKTKLADAQAILRALKFNKKQQNDTAAYTLLACVAVGPDDAWTSATSPLRGITPIIEFIRDTYGVKYAPNTRETIRDEAVKFFVEMGLLLRNPDAPMRPTNSGKTVYQIEPAALRLIQAFGTKNWDSSLAQYLDVRRSIVADIDRHREVSRVPVRLPSGKSVTLSPGGQNPLIKSILEEFCSRWIRNGVVLYIGDTENKFVHMEVDFLRQLGVALESSDKIPDVVIYDPDRNWLVLIEAVTSAGPVDGKRRRELKSIFAASTAGLVFVTAFLDRGTMRRFVAEISWETEVWIAESPDHMIHFNGDRFLGPYPDVAASKS